MRTTRSTWANRVRPTCCPSRWTSCRPPVDDEEPPEGLLGDIVLCPAVTARQAAEHGRTPEAEAEYLLVHGLLHLLGYDHGTAQEQADMFGLKDDLLAAWATERAQRSARGTRVR